jgi:3'(2'), 5'-bisphosphate nucleotidase
VTPEETVAGTSFARRDVLDLALVLAAEAGVIVMGVYADAFDVEYKGKDDPVTRADKLANDHITRALAAAFPGIPIVAEESDPATFAGYEASESAFFVDPLDGTREFVARNGQFAVMIGLAEKGRATLGVVGWPALGRTFAGMGGEAFEVSDAGARTPLHVSRKVALEEARVVVSRSHRSEATAEVIARLSAAKVDQVGSAGVKGTLVACGEADVYVHPGVAGKLWDTCAPEAIVRAAGGDVTDATGRVIDYRGGQLANARGVLMTNGALHAAVLARTPAAE